MELMKRRKLLAAALAGAALTPLVHAADADSLLLVINNKEYKVLLESNATARDIAAKLPLKLTLNRFRNHEFYTNLPFNPSDASATTTQLKAGHLYYWPGGNAFVVTYKEFDTYPYREVHLGEITDPSVSELLENCGDSVSVEIR
jgi:hypothetical protein